MTSLLPLTQDLIRAFGWTLLHSFWQAFCIFACLRIVLKIWPMANAAIKYHLSYLSLAGITGWFAVTFFNQWSSIREAHAAGAMVSQLDAGAVHAVPQQAPLQTGGLQTMMPGMEAYFPFLVAVYVAGVLFMTVKLSIDLTQLRQMRRQGVSSPGAQWDHYITALARRMGITRKVQLFISQHLQVPVMIGFLKPVILLPAAMVSNLSPEQLEAILLHELAHIKRNDYLLNIFQSIVETILFFNPFVWWISKNIRLEREHCCDDLVIAGTVQPLHYAKALVALEEYRLTVNPMAMAAADDKHHLFHRIKRIMEMKTKHLNYSQRLLALLIIVTGLVSIAWLTPGKTEKDEPCTKNNSAVCDTIPAPPVAPVALAAKIPPPPPVLPADAATVPEPPVSPAAPVPAPSPIYTPAPLAPLAPIAPMPAMAPDATPLPPMPPLPPVPAWDDWNMDTTHPRKKIIIRDDKGTHSYNSVEEMPADVREKYEMTQEKLKALRLNKETMAASIKAAQDAVEKIDWSKMNAQIQESMKKVDWDKMNRDVQAAMKKANREMAAKMKEVDWNKIGADLNKNLKSVQWEKISEEVKQKLNSTDWEKVEKEIKEKIEKIDWKKIEEDIKNNPSSYRHGMYSDEALAMTRQAQDRAARQREAAEQRGREARELAQRDNDRAREAAAQQASAARRRAEIDADRALQTAERQSRRAREQAEREGERARMLAEQQGIAARERAEKDAARALQTAERQGRRAREQAGEARVRAAQHEALARRHREDAEKSKAAYDELLDKMESDNLINRNNNFEISKQGNDLYINGRKQPDDVKKKYEQYLKNENVSIKGNKNSLNVHSQDNR